MKSGVIGGVIGSLMGVLLGAAAFRSGTPVDARFTYQGQIRDGEALVSGNVDIRFSLWDALDGGSMIGSALTKTSLPVTDGRFATELDFGTSAFSGDARWIQMEFRSPAGAGQYTTLAPRQRVNAVPYALYSLNGGLSPWNLDVPTRDIGYVNGKVGIGTNAPSATFEVVSATGGDESVKLPAGSIGAAELVPGISALGMLPEVVLGALNGQAVSRTFNFEVVGAGVLSFSGAFEVWQCSGVARTRILIDGMTIHDRTGSGSWNQVCPISAGRHTLQVLHINEGSLFPCRGAASTVKLTASVAFGSAGLVFE
jgi:hypothetical protein